MAVLVEGISVVVRRDVIDDRFPGGWRQFVRAVPNDTLCTDEEIIRVGFMSRPDVEEFTDQLEKEGLVFARNRQAVDIAVVDQVNGPTLPNSWLEFARLSLTGSDNKVSACWLFEGKRNGAGIHMPSMQMSLATPEGWRYEDSLSANFKFVPDEPEPVDLPNERPSSVDVAIESAGRILQVQLALGGASSSRVFGDNFALGYMFGVHDAIFQSLNIGTGAEGFAGMSMSYARLFDDDVGTRILRRSLDLQRDRIFMEGMFSGGREAIAFLREQRAPLALSAHLRS